MNKAPFFLGVLTTTVVIAGVFLFWKALDKLAPVPVDLSILPNGTGAEEDSPTEELAEEAQAEVRDFIPLATYVKQNTTTSLQFEYFYLLQAPNSQTELEFSPWSEKIDLVESGIADAITTGSLLSVERLEFLPVYNKYGDTFRVFFFEASDEQTVVEAIQPALSDGRWGGIPTYEMLSTEACEWWLVDDFEECTVFKMKGTPLVYEITPDDEDQDRGYSEGDVVLIRYGVEGQTSLYALFYFDKTRLGREFENFEHLTLSSLQAHNTLKGQIVN